MIGHAVNVVHDDAVDAKDHWQAELHDLLGVRVDAGGCARAIAVTAFCAWLPLEAPTPTSIGLH
jgi:hypothetical protein